MLAMKNLELIRILLLWITSNKTLFIYTYVGICNSAQPSVPRSFNNAFIGLRIDEGKILQRITSVIICELDHYNVSNIRVSRHGLR